MFFKKKEKENEQKNTVGTFSGLVNLTKSVFKKRDLKIEKREITKEDKKAALLTVIIVVGLGLLLWFLPFTHKFMEDFIFLRS